MTKIVLKAENRPKSQNSSQKRKIEPKARDRQKIPNSQQLTEKPRIDAEAKNQPK